MRDFFVFCSGIAFHRFDIRILAEQNTIFEAWPGAVLRNNLLYATAQVEIPGKGVSLFEYCCKQLPLPVAHPLYKEMKQGFPPPFYLYTSADRYGKESYKIQRNEVLNFSFVLVGEFCSYIPYFIEAIQSMCRKGMGVDAKPFTFIDIHEVSFDGKRRLLASGKENMAGPLSYRISMPLYESHGSRKGNAIRIVFESPVSLMKQGKVSEKAGYQEKSNGFPAFYQLVRSAAYRVEKLAALFCIPNEIDGYIASHEEIEDYVEDAAIKIRLKDANIRHVSFQSTRKEGTDKRIPLMGFTGEMTFTGDYTKYVPLLRCIEQLGVGEKLTYGFGKIRLEEIPVRLGNELLRKKGEDA